MTGFSLSLQAKALTSMIATLTVAGGVVWHWHNDEPAIFLPARPRALALPLTDDPKELHQSPHVRMAVVRAATNLATDYDAELAVKHFVESDIRRVWVQFKQDETDEAVGGEVFYPSKIAPVASGFADGRLLRFVTSLHRAGIEVAAWLPAFHDPAAWAAHKEWRAHSVREDGSVVEQEDWLCPRCPEAVEYEASLLAEAASLCKGELAGVYTDFVRYDDDFSCACSRCIGELEARRHSGKVSPMDIRKAIRTESPLWQAWTTQRADAIHDALNAMRDELSKRSPGIWFGASVLPFSALDYELNTQSGQNLAKMCRAGLDEIVLMGYWDDWGNRPQWLADCISHANDLVGGEAKLSCLLDADMSVHRTMKTLDAVLPTGCDLVWFNYGSWTAKVLGRLQQASDQWQKHGGCPQAPFTAVCLRIDTEPDSAHRYDTVTPEMIGKLAGLFNEEQIKATFVTCGTIAERQPEALKAAIAAGHEVAGHAYDHEQLDGLPESGQLQAIDRMAHAFDRCGIQLNGFGAPRNSITDAARDHLIELGYFYDGSEAYDPLESYLDPQIVAHTKEPQAGIVLLPFIIPNDYDARFVLKLNATQMMEAWVQRLNATADAHEPCYVLDIHQWIASQPDNFEALRQFIRSVKKRSDCRFLTLNDTAKHALAEIQRAEGTLVARP